MADANGTLTGRSEPEPELRQLLHQLNNQLSVILAHAELLEAKAVDGFSRSRASQLVTGALSAMTTVRAISERVDPPPL